MEIKINIIALLILFLLTPFVLGVGEVYHGDDVHLTGDEKKLFFYNGDYYISIRASGSLAANYNLVLPVDDGDAAQALLTNGNGAFYFDTPVTFHAHNILSATHTDTLVDTVVRGDLLIGNSTPKYARKALGAAGYIIRSDGTDADWAATTNITELGTIATGVWQATDVGVQYGGTGVSSLTDGGILLGSGTGPITALGVAANGQIPIGDGTTDPVLATITPVADETDVTNAAGTITIGIVDPLAVTKGGTGAATFTDGGILLGSGAGVITALGVATNGQIPIGDGTTDPVLATLTGTANQVNVTNGAGSITLSTPQDIAAASSPTFAGLTVVNAITEFSTDDTLGGNSDSALPTEQAVKAYVDGQVSGSGNYTFKTINPDTGTDPVADSAADILNITITTADAAALLAVSGNASTDTVTFTADTTPSFTSVAADTAQFGSNGEIYIAGNAIDTINNYDLYLDAAGTGIIDLRTDWTAAGETCQDLGTVTTATSITTKTLVIDNTGATDAVLTMDGSSNDAGTLTYESDNTLFIFDKGVTSSATITAEQLTSTDDITMQGHLLTMGDDASADDVVLSFKSSGNDATITYDQSDDEFHFGDATITTTGNIAGTLTTVAQGNITSVGTLSSLTVGPIGITASAGEDLNLISPAGQDIVIAPGAEGICKIDEDTHINPKLQVSNEASWATWNADAYGDSIITCYRNDATYFQATGYGTDKSGGIIMSNARGSFGSKAKCEDTDRVWLFLGRAWDSAAWRHTSAVAGWVDGATSSGNMPMRMTFETGETTSRTARIDVKADGRIFMPEVYDDVISSARDIQMDANGQLGYVSSSIDTKKNIQDLDEATWIYELRPVIYDMNDGSAIGVVGLIAEEVAPSIPNLVSYKRIEVGEEIILEDETGKVVKPIYATSIEPATVNYSQLIVPMLREMQRLREDVDILKAKVE